jgi:hypothetical protein
VFESLVRGIVAMLATVESWQLITNNFGPKLKFLDRFRVEILEPDTQ